MRESRTYGSVRGAQGDLRPYRDRIRKYLCNQLITHISFHNVLRLGERVRF
jgi:hypothetical protein